MKYLIDTNVISETRRKRPDSGVIDFIKTCDEGSLYFSVLSLGEIAKGCEIIAQRDPEAAVSLSNWLAEVRRDFENRTLSIDVEIAEAWGRFSAIRPIPVNDGLKAATAFVHGLTLVTRNVRDFHGIDIRLINPWT